LAIATLSSHQGAESIEDPVTLLEAALLFKETGLPEFSPRLDRVVRKLQRWADQDGLYLERRGKGWVVSYSDLLESHACRHPAPGPSRR
jgi:hypothetical protein